MLGDIAFVIFLTYYISVSNCFNVIHVSLASFFACFFFLAIFTKSGIYPFFDWLFQAMEGPTPVSAFLHACSMITAGVWLCLLLCGFYSKIFILLFLIISSIFYGFCAITYFDVKRIVASSTGSYMSFILLILIFGGFSSLSFNFLVIHASFKFIIFCIMGFLIVYNLGFQDFRFVKHSTNLSLYLIFFTICMVGLSFFWLGSTKENLLINVLFSLSPFSILFMISFSFTFIYCFILIKYQKFNYTNSSSLNIFTAFNLFILFYICFFILFFFNLILGQNLVIAHKVIFFYVIMVNLILILTLFSRFRVLAFLDLYWFPQLLTLYLNNFINFLNFYSLNCYVFILKIIN